MTIEEYQEQKDKMNQYALNFVNNQGLFSFHNSKSFYRNKARGYLPKDGKMLDYIELVVPYYQLSSIVEQLQFNIEVLEDRKEKLGLKFQGRAYNREAKNIDKTIEQTKEQLEHALDRFSKISKSKIDGWELYKHVAKFKSLIFADKIVGSVNNNYISPVPDYRKNSSLRIKAIYEEYQYQLESVDKHKPRVLRYKQYMDFMREKSECNGVEMTNRKIVRTFEKNHEGDVLLSNPRYIRNQTPKFDMSRLDAFEKAVNDLPFSTEQIQEFASQFNKKHMYDYER